MHDPQVDRASSEALTNKASFGELILFLLLFCLGIVVTAGNLVSYGFALLFNVRNGWVVPNPDTPTINMLELSPQHILRWQLGLVSGIGTCCTAVAFFRRKRRIALCLFACTILVEAIGRLCLVFVSTGR